MDDNALLVLATVAILDHRRGVILMSSLWEPVRQRLSDEDKAELRLLRDEMLPLGIADMGASVLNYLTDVRTELITHESGYVETVRTDGGS